MSRARKQSAPLELPTVVFDIVCPACGASIRSDDETHRDGHAPSQPEE